MDWSWATLNHMQLGRYGEYYAKMEFARLGFDVYSAEVDDKGIDFVIRKKADRYYDVQVKSFRGFKYIFFRKDKFELRENMLAALVHFAEGQLPEVYLVPSTKWKNPKPPFTSKDYVGLKSKPEWGLEFAKAHLNVLSDLRLQEIAGRL